MKAATLQTTDKGTPTQTVAKKISSVDMVLDYLMSAIQGGTIAPGQRLITTELANQIGTSQAPVREALHLLAGEGVLEMLTNRGFRVRTLTYRDLLDGVQILQVVGALAIRLASEKIKDAKYAETVQNTVGAIQTAGEQRDARGFFKAISATHRMVNELAGNNYLNPVIDRIHLEYFNYQLSGLLPGNWDRYIENYKRMGEHYKAGDAKALEKEFVKHLDWVKTLLEEKVQLEEPIHG